MTYNNTAFMGVPWDIIIKQYRKKLKDDCFPTVEDYMLDFVSYLSSSYLQYCSDVQQHHVVQNILSFYFKNQLQIIKHKEKSETVNYNDYFNEQLKYFWTLPILHQFLGYSLNNFYEYSHDDIDRIISKFNELRSVDFFVIKEICFFLCITSVCKGSYSGLVFTGYGNNEIYPSLVPMIIDGVIEGRMRYFIDDVNRFSITDSGQAAIMPFAQTDVVQTIIRGYNPSFNSIVNEILKDSMTDLKQIIAKVSGNVSKPLSNAINSIDLQSFLDKAIVVLNRKMFDTYSQSLLTTLTNLDKEDMANMAESFVALTSLIRRMSPREETVGGPVDVAVISKGDGFIWIKRKHYFDPALNNHFFENYYK